MNIKMNVKKEISLRDASFILSKFSVVDELSKRIDTFNKIEFENSDEKLDVLLKCLDNFITDANDKYTGIMVRIGLDNLDIITEKIIVEGDTINDVDDNIKPLKDMSYTIKENNNKLESSTSEMISRL